MPDCGVSCIEVYGRFTENHIKAQYIYVMWLLMKKCLQRMKEQTSQRRLAPEVQWLTGLMIKRISTDGRSFISKLQLGLWFTCHFDQGIKQKLRPDTAKYQKTRRKKAERFYWKQIVLLVKTTDRLQCGPSYCFPLIVLLPILWRWNDPQPTQL